tara:strand:+ start:790 stop:975 length:186 start_codon:yes stop_codon:yes gene_type:complete
MKTKTPKQIILLLQDNELFNYALKNDLLVYMSMALKLNNLPYTLDDSQAIFDLYPETTGVN